MIRATKTEDKQALLKMTADTGLFKDHEVDSLLEVLEDWLEGYADDRDLCVTMLEKGTVCGFAYFGPEQMTLGTWLLWWIVVRPDRQGSGLGTKLLKYVENVILEDNGRVLFIETSSLPSYEATWQFYLKQGYEREGLLRDYFSPGDHKIVFRKVLTTD